MKFLHNFEQYSIRLKINEGGKALDHTRPIKQFEVAKTFEDIKQNIFSKFKLQGFGKDVLSIGSAGKKADENDISGDLDIGIDVKAFCSANDIYSEVFETFLYNELKTLYPDREIVWNKGLQVISMAWPIEGDESKGMVQLDFLPIIDMNWAKFIYHCPDYKKNESLYKSAVRNWLFAAIVSTCKDDETKDNEDHIIKYEGYMMKLSGGLYKVVKSYVGKKKILKHSKKESEEFVTSDPQKFVTFILGEGVKPKDVETFESSWAIINNPEYKWYDRLPEIKEQLIKFLQRVDLSIPKEINE